MGVRDCKIINPLETKVVLGKQWPFYCIRNGGWNQSCQEVNKQGHYDGQLGYPIKITVIATTKCNSVETNGGTVNCGDVEERSKEFTLRLFFLNIIGEYGCRSSRNASCAGLGSSEISIQV